MNLTNITQAFVEIQSQVKANPILTAFLGMWGATIVGYVFRKVPSKLWNTITCQLTTSVTINNTGNWITSVAYVEFGNFFRKQKGSNLSRNYILEATYDSMPSTDREADFDGDRVSMGPGVGTHVFLYNRRIFWIRKEEKESQGSGQQKYTLTVSTMGRSREPIDNLVNQILPKKNKDQLSVFNLNSDKYWDLTANITRRPMESVIMPSSTKQEITGQLDEFYSMEDWYASNGIAHKLVAMLYGKPGCGKTSLIRALASKYGANVYSLNLNEVSDRSLPVVLSRVPRGSFVLIEDFDSFSAVKSREDENHGDAVSFLKDEAPLTLSGVLNSLDGIVSLNKVVVFLTTNHIEKIDPAILRAGRTDIALEIGYLGSDEIKEFVRVVYDKDIDGEFECLPGCKLHGLLLKHKLNFGSFHSELLTKHSKKLPLCKDKPITMVKSQAKINE